VVADALDRLSLGGHAGGDELGNLRGRAQGFGAAVVLYVDRSRHGVPGELSLVRGWAVSNGGPFLPWLTSLTLPGKRRPAIREAS